MPLTESQKQLAEQTSYADLEAMALYYSNRVKGYIQIWARMNGLPDKNQEDLRVSEAILDTLVEMLEYKRTLFIQRIAEIGYRQDKK